AGRDPLRRRRPSGHEVCSQLAARRRSGHALVGLVDVRLQDRDSHGALLLYALEPEDSLPIGPHVIGIHSTTVGSNTVTVMPACVIYAFPRLRGKVARR